MKKFLFLLAVIVVLVPATAKTDVRDDEIAELREQIRLLSARLDELERAGAPAAPETAMSEKPEASRADAVEGTPEQQLANEERIDELESTVADMAWAQRMRWAGDFRYRYESIDVEGADVRRRNRIRARAHLEADVSDTVEVGFGLATGGDDPVSTNQTLGGGGSTKDVRLDLAYFDWKVWDNTRLTGGKVKNFLFRPAKSQLLWDSDWRPEGGGFIWDNGTWFAQALGTWIESDTNKGDEFAWVGQAGAKFRIGDNVKLTVGAGYSRFNTAGNGSYFGDDDDFFGNSFDPLTNTYLYNYHTIEAFAELQTELAGHPLLLWGDYITNTDVDENDEGYELGIRWGKASGWATWDISYAYKRLEADAALGLLTDSDFGGGGTDAKGSILRGTWGLHKNWNARFTYFINQTDLATNDPRDFDRLQLDLNFKYK